MHAGCVLGGLPSRSPFQCKQMQHVDQPWSVLQRWGVDLRGRRDGGDCAGCIVLRRDGAKPGHVESAESGHQSRSTRLHFAKFLNKTALHKSQPPRGTTYCIHCARDSTRNRTLFLRSYKVGARRPLHPPLFISFQLASTQSCKTVLPMYFIKTTAILLYGRVSSTNSQVAARAWLSVPAAPLPAEPSLHERILHHRAHLRARRLRHHLRVIH